MKRDLLAEKVREQAMKKKMSSTLKLIRPKQWIKNFAVFPAIVFTGQLFTFPLLLKIALAFVAFCGLSSAVYIVNDIYDIPKDRMHPSKKFRPLAHGDLSLPYALFLFLVLSICALLIALVINTAFFIVALGYLALQLSYSMLLKNITILDILVLAMGYILRVYGGEIASGYHISAWLILTTISLSLFLAVGKRRSELTLISHFTEKQIETIRKTLSHYSERLLDIYAAIFVASTLIFYSLFTFFEASYGGKVTNNSLLSALLLGSLNRRWLMLSIPVVVYGLMRYLQDIYEKHEGESPEKVVLSDTPLLISILIWVGVVISVIYLL